MIPTPDLDARLQRHHQELVRRFSGHRVATPAPRRRVGRRLIMGLAVAVAAAIAAPLVTLRLAPSGGARQVHVAGFTITVAASDQVAPRMTNAQAIAVAQAFNASHPVNLPHGGPSITGLTVTGAWFVPDAEHVVGPCVNFYLPRPANIWVVPITAPAQSGWNGVRGAFLVEDATGTTNGAQLLMGPARSGPPAC